jgi:hypothetical protein
MIACIRLDVDVIAYVAISIVVVVATLTASLPPRATRVVQQTKDSFRTAHDVTVEHRDAVQRRFFHALMIITNASLLLEL